eukprot:5593862-Pleurochrysis_carterae.AAC.1
MLEGEHTASRQRRFVGPTRALLQISIIERFVVAALAVSLVNVFSQRAVADSGLAVMDQNESSESEADIDALLEQNLA